jgi:predicted transposase YbfD/YdcC
VPKKTFEAGADAQIDLIIQLKDNQPTLHQQAKDLCASATPLSHVSSRDRGRNRQEERSVAVFNAANAFTDTEWSALVGVVIRVERDVLTRSASTGLWRRSTETAFYLSSTTTTTITAARAAIAIRDHWKIENISHYSRDVTMGEDRSRIRINPGIFARLRSFAFNILKSNRRSSLSQDRFRAAIGGLDRLLNLLRIPER